MNYFKNYQKSINKGIINTKFSIEGKDFDAELFFNNLINYIKEIHLKNGRLFFFGNGASAAISNHMALDWSKNGDILSFSLSDSSLLTALSNDYSYEECFLEFLKIHAPNKNDLVITTSSSGNSINIFNVLKFCNANHIKTLGFSGLNNKNKTIELADFSVFVPLKTYGMVECIHQVFHHLILDKFMNIKEWDKIHSQNMDSNNFIL